MTLPPLVAVDGRLELDYPALLLVDGIILDEVVFDYVAQTARSNSEFGSLAESLRVLAGEGFAEVRDYSIIARAHAADILAVGRGYAADYERWLPAIRYDLRTWWDDVDDLSSVAPRSFTEAHKCGYAIGSHLLDVTGRIDPREVARIHKLIFSQKKRRTRMEKETLSAVMQPNVEMLYLNDLIRRELNVTRIYDWPQTREFYLARIDEDPQTKKAKELFRLFPNSTPHNAREFLPLVRDRGVTALRKHIESLVDSDTPLDESYQREVYEQRERATRQFEKMRTYVGYGMSLLGLLPGGGLAQAVVQKAADATIERVLNDVYRGEYRWLYFTSERARNKR